MTEIGLPSPRWGASTKLVVALTAVVLVGLTLWRVQFLIAPMVSSVMIAYLLHPVITFVSGRLKWPRALVAALLFLVLLVAILASATGLGIYLYSQISNLNVDVQQIVAELPKRIDELTHSHYTIGGFTIDLSRFDFTEIYSQIAEAVQPALAEAGAIARDTASGAAEFFGWMIFVLLISFYIVKDMPSLPAKVEQFAADPGYSHDVRRLLHETQRIWDAFLRGQLILAIVVAVANAIGLMILDVDYAIVIGLLSGILIFIPYIGPTAIAIIGAGVALFQPGNWFGIPPIPYALIVFAWFVIVQQFADYVLTPRIIGEHLHLHPALIVIGAIMGAGIGGFIGLLLAAPLLATCILVGRYAWRKMLDLPPFPDEAQPHDSQPALSGPKFDLRALLNRFKSSPAKSKKEGQI